jgi:transitional endoplasmic reticulum ATPase
MVKVRKDYVIHLSKLKTMPPSIIFIDELDSIAPKRDEVSGDVEKRIVYQLLTLMDGLEARGKVVVIGATNRVNSIDPALRRPGRFDREIEIGIPDEEGRLDILHIHTRGMPLTDNIKLEYFAKITHGFVGADLESLCKEAAMRSLTRVIPEINLDQTKIPIEVLNKIRIGRFRRCTQRYPSIGNERSADTKTKCKVGRRRRTG